MKTPHLHTLVGAVALLLAACVLPPNSAGEDDDMDTGTGSSHGPPGMTSPSMTSPGMTSVGTTSGVDPTADDDTADDGSDTTDTDTEGGGDCPTAGPAGLPGVNPEFIWVPHNRVSTQSLISKIDTVTMMPVARYATRDSDLSQTRSAAVGLSGNVVVGDNGDGGFLPDGAGLTMFYGDPTECTDLDGDGVVTTSTGPDDVVPWDDEECRAWFLPLDYISQVGVGWTPGVVNDQTCEREDEQIWTFGQRPDATVEATLVDAEGGTILATVGMPDFVGEFIGWYNGAVDRHGNLWAHRFAPEGSTNDTLVRIDHETLDVDTWPSPEVGSTGRGFTVGRSGYVFVCSEKLTRFDPSTETWTVGPEINGHFACTEDAMGRVWSVSFGIPDPTFDYALVSVGVESLAIEEVIPLDDTSASFFPALAFDFQHQLWAVGGWDTITRLDLGTSTQALLSGLPDRNVGYSGDLTGFKLANQLAP